MTPLFGLTCGTGTSCKRFFLSLMDSIPFFNGFLRVIQSDELALMNFDSSFMNALNWARTPPMQAHLRLLRTHLRRNQLTLLWLSTAMVQNLSQLLILYRFSSSLNIRVHNSIACGRRSQLATFRHRQSRLAAALDKTFIRTNPNQRLPSSAGRSLVGPVTCHHSHLGRGAPTLFQTSQTKRASGTFWFHDPESGLVLLIKIYLFISDFKSYIKQGATTTRGSGILSDLS